MKFRITEFLFLTILLLPIFSLAIAGKSQERKFGKYEVSLSEDFQKGIGRIVVKQGKAKVFEEVGFGNHYYFGNNFEPNSDEPPDVYSGRNITGNGVTNLVVSNWTGGAHCCHFLSIFEIGKDLKRLVTVEGRSASIRLVDLDDDSYPEIEFWDGAIDENFTSYSMSPGGRVVLKFRKDRYEVATTLMKKPRPSSEKIKVLKQALEHSFEEEQTPNLPHIFLKTLMDLSYSGHFELALQLVEEAWPDKKPGLKEFKRKFSEALKDSQYWREFYNKSK